VKIRSNKAVHVAHRNNEECEGLCGDRDGFFFVKVQLVALQSLNCCIEEDPPAQLPCFPIFVQPLVVCTRKGGRFRIARKENIRPNLKLPLTSLAH
jgi:hypothetical protein